MIGLHLESLVIYEVMFLMGIQTTSQRNQEPAKFSLTSLIETVIPSAIHPLVAAGSNKCETLKSFFGLTYEQMQGKNATNFDVLNIDLVTKNGNVKYNLTSTKRINRLTKNAETVVVLVHGFMESSEGLMVQVLSQEFLKQSGWTILALDGRKVINLEYFRSSTYVRFIGERLGTLLSNIIKNGQDPKKMMLVGHSLGAHIAGIASKHVQQQIGQHIGRIAALDPAGPCFSNIDKAGRLDPTDAAYVDVIHTNAGILGVKDPVGHKDFYPNGGMSQPGCILSTCDHSRAWELFAESITAPHHFPARKCDNWTSFQAGLCVKNEMAFMGIESEAGSPGIYFLPTRSSIPFGMGPAGSA